MTRTLREAIAEEWWYWWEMRAQKLWLRLCPADKATYWLDFLPAFFARRYYASINRRIARTGR